jgi:hypothetical protein
VAVTSASRNTIDTANYSGHAGTSFSDPVLVPNGSDAVEATSGLGAFPGADNFSVSAGLAAGMVGTRADALTSPGNPFVANGGSVDPSGGSGVASVNNVAEGNATGAGNSDGRNTASAKLAITVSARTTLQFSFSDAINLMASTTNPSESAIASVANTFTIEDSAGNVVFEFTPDGHEGLLDPFNINGSLSSDSGSLAAPISDAGSFLSDISPSLAAGTYTLGLRSGSNENIVAVPVTEPAGLMVLGVGVIALGVAGRWRNRHRL